MTPHSRCKKEGGGVRGGGVRWSRDLFIPSECRQTVRDMFVRMY